jgi:hypothetical protein
MNAKEEVLKPIPLIFMQFHISVFNQKNEYFQT